MRRADCRGRRAFALYEVLIGVTIFAVGVLALGRSVQNCMNADSLNSEEARVRQLLANRMAEVQATPGLPDLSKEFKIDTGYGVIRLVQKTRPAPLKTDQNVEISGLNEVTLTANWSRGGIDQAKELRFYVYRAG